jgi:hypothetical protein
MVRYISILIFYVIFSDTYAQTDTIGKTKYTSDYTFAEGIYLTFDQFKADNPAIKTFFLKKPVPYSDPNYTVIEYICDDSIKTPGKCEIMDCWGYSYRGDVYISHSYYAYYFKLMVVGSVCHFVGLSGVGSTATDIMTGFGGDNEFKQFFLDFETGDVQLFNYKYFSAFLKTHDDALYQELIKQKKRKKLIFKYLLKYNEKHPIYIG